jgi:uncharacterized cupin superfamily protein
MTTQITLAPIHFNALQPEITVQHPDPDKRIKGNPKRTAREYFANDVHGVRAGTWEAEEGAYRIALAADKHEFFHIISGRVAISAPDGSGTVRYAAGDTGVIPPGFQGIFEIEEAASKFWVVTERSL